MYISLFKRVFTAGVIYCLAVNSAFSTPLSETNKNLAWQRWLKNQIELHPDVITAKQQLKARLSLADGRSQPLYNPELETEFERLDNTNKYRLGISQTLDIWDKRGNRRQQADFIRLAAKQAYLQTYQQKLAEALSVLTTYQASKARFLLAQQQEQQINTLFTLIQNRQQAGDLGQVEVNFSLASLTQRLNETALAMADFRRAEAQAQELFSSLPSDKSVIPTQLWQVMTGSIVDKPLSETVDSHPRVLLAKAQWDVEKEAAELARLDTKADPTLGINTGRDGDEDIVGLSFSIPLNVRNNFSAERRAADEQALAAEAAYLAKRRQQQYQIQATASIAQQYQKKLQRLKSLLQQSNEESLTLLEQQWQTGDLGTNEYLIALQQNMVGALSGIELQEKFQLAVIDWLKASGQVTTRILPPGSSD
ncbi:outer membrane protein2C probably efflux family [gamma proteobacterium IMCC2047]|nr:outer membrane protein2C probably efflux family [gamma proteobacterium IMCC2047]